MYYNSEKKYKNNLINFALTIINTYIIIVISKMTEIAFKNLNTYILIPQNSYQYLLEKYRRTIMC